MIALLNDCLLFQLATGESVPCSAEMISVEIVGGQDRTLDPEVLRHAAASVFHYFKKELMRESVSVGEFAVALERVLLDPGIGFGKTLQHNLKILGRLEEFAVLGRPLVIGVSRKSFLGTLTGVGSPDQRVIASVAAGLVAWMKGAVVLRVHDVAAHAQALRVVAAITGGG